MVVGGVAGVDAVWAVDQSGVMLVRWELGKGMDREMNGQAYSRL